MLIDFFTKETPTSLFIQDVFSTVNFDVSLHIASTPAAATALLKSVTALAPIVIWDLDSFGDQNTQALADIRERYPDSQILVYGENPEDYGNLSNKLYDIILSVDAVRLHLMSKISKLKDIYSARQIFNERMSHLVGKSDAMQQLRKSVERAIIHTGPVLIQGETGVGKELIARAVSCIYDKFITVNCSAIPDNLFESELFGHVRGAFTGAQNERIGLFEAADGGAIFLDEIGDMPLHAQVKLLRVLQEKEIRPIGANKTKHIDVRIVAATNRDLKEAVRNKTFREDLYYRLSVIPLKISPLRERKEDIEDLANYFIQQYQTPEEQYSLSDDALTKLRDHTWPGNIRELENVIQRAICFASSSLITADTLQLDDSLDFAPQEASIEADTYDQFRDKQLDQEREFLKRKIRENNGSVRNTAQQLGLQRTALYNRLNHLGVDVKDLK
ncbi:MAG: sigma 54-interacting transcriptional regulator [Fibrobacter sp.]|nr:sigma 54-interacting transcriptional regulator [Fibrobacter sp.]